MPRSRAPLADVPSVAVVAVATVTLLLPPACTALGDRVVHATPQRPTVASSTSTTAVGTVELEFGALLDEQDSAALPTTLKAGLDERTEFYLSGAPWMHLEGSGPPSNGASDLLLGLRHRFLDADEASFPLAAFANLKLPTASRPTAFSSSEVDLFAGAMVEHSLDEKVGLLGYYELGLLGDPDAQGIDLRHTVALDASWSVTPGLGLFAEISAVYDRGTDARIWQGLLGVAFPLAPDFVLDVAGSRGLSAQAPDWTVQAGFTFNLSRVFGARARP